MDEARIGEVRARTARAAENWLDTVTTRRVGPGAAADHLVEVFGGELPAHPTPVLDVVETMAAHAPEGLMAIGSGRFFGWVMGGTLPAALAADWLVSAWDQNAGMRHATPAVAALEEVAAQWVLDLLGLPAGSDVGFTTGATMANFTGLAAARFVVLDRVGWDVHRDGLNGAPRLRVLVGAERHDTVDLALRYLGLGLPEPVAADDQGRVRLDALAEALEAGDPGAPTIVVLQAGNLHSGAFDPLAEAVDLAHRHGAFVHVDGAFGLWAAASPRLAHLAEGVARADSWATDAHKTLNTTYDCGIVVVRDAAALRAAMGVHTSYLTAAEGPGNPLEKVPELSRRARGVPVWAALRSLGRDGVADLVERLARRAGAIAAGVRAIPEVTVLNEVVYTQVCFAVGDDARTVAVADALAASGEVWVSASRWGGRAVVRVSVSNAATDEHDVVRTVEAVRQAVALTRG